MIGFSFILVRVIEIAALAQEDICRGDVGADLRQ